MSTYAALHARLTSPAPDHVRFTGPAIDIAGITPEELGTLWPLLHAARREKTLQPLADDVFRQVAQAGMAPALDSATLAATLRVLHGAGHWGVSLAEQFACFAGAPTAELAQALVPMLSNEAGWARGSRQRAALLILAGADEALAGLAQVIEGAYGSSLTAREFAVLATLGRRALVALAAVEEFSPDDVAARRWLELAGELGQEPAYMEFARDALEAAGDAAQRVQSGAVPYKPDAAFTPDDARVLGLAARAAAAADAPWYGDAITRLLPAVCVAPTAAKTVPSQALTTALGHAIEAVPTPESVAALREASRVVRHAGLKKKLARNVKPAERGLAARPEVALRLGDVGLPPKQQRALLAAFFDTALCRPFTLPYGEWRARLLAGAVMTDHARALVWSAGAAFMLGDGDVPVDAGGRPLVLPDDAPVTLWHPVESGEAEREAWRAHVLRHRLHQPVRQVFREFYTPRPDEDDACGHFAGYELGTVRLLGLARREGWKLDGGTLTRRFGDVRAAFRMSWALYPGCDGTVATETIDFTRGPMALPVRDVPPRVLSEACRAADLLVSVAAVALESEELEWPRLRLLSNGSGVHAVRRQVLERLLHAQIAAGRVAIEGFHVHAGGARVSMRTGRVMRDGAPVDLALKPASKKLGAVPWLPYDEALLERVVHSVAALLDDDHAPACG
ncbi:DUF4132 domain-containing protein [Massilia dura]|uniref:DUF4132 domain-containing protein n=1 Tax=Pseudoduganella dura TaxID=321982 RepID=A0A6I3XC40_9BURK|nr:DUF4132 domain-containing protein [Pseudoduganella dura]MUI11081.1 DUF4132 domain-containing protein [Pseudoduganella dura]GGY03288.1 hypothetical protein GCM10007386_37770 [Pseudoduganella dura]